MVKGPDKREQLPKRALFPVSEAATRRAITRVGGKMSGIIDENTFSRYQDSLETRSLSVMVNLAILDTNKSAMYGIEPCTRYPEGFLLYYAAAEEHAKMNGLILPKVELEDINSLAHADLKLGGVDDPDYLISSIQRFGLALNLSDMYSNPDFSLLERIDKTTKKNADLDTQAEIMVFDPNAEENKRIYTEFGTSFKRGMELRHQNFLAQERGFIDRINKELWRELPESDRKVLLQSASDAKALLQAATAREAKG
jgi:hypothetical protein